MSIKYYATEDYVDKTIDNKFAGCWISFTDEDGNPTNEPYIHFTVDEQGNPVYNSEISLAEDGEF